MLLLIHLISPTRFSLSAGALTGDGSTQISPNHSLEVQVVAVVVAVLEVRLGLGGGDVIGCEFDVVEVSSLHPKNKPGVSHVGVDDEGEVVVGSLQPPKKPGD